MGMASFTNMAIDRAMAEVEMMEEKAKAEAKAQAMPKEEAKPVAVKPETARPAARIAEKTEKVEKKG